jgi:osmoprotectant transport system permease protein
MKLRLQRQLLVGRDSVEPTKYRAFSAPRSVALPIVLLFFTISVDAESVRIGSKKFTESYVLGEITKRTLSEAGIPVEFRQGMGGTIIVWQALRTNQIDVYPDYTGTIVQEILKRSDPMQADSLADELRKSGIGMTKPLGFNNTYAFVMRRDRATALGIRTISDLQTHPELKFGFTHEFLNRQDGWQPLTAVYRLNPANVIGIDHSLGYDALRNGAIDVMDAYSTDAKIAEYDLFLLEDDQKFFPRYDAVFLYRLSLDERVVARLRGLEGKIDDAKMRRINAEAERTKNYAQAASLFFDSTTGSTPNFGETFWHKLARWTTRHLELAGLSLLLSIIVGVPLGIWASRGGAIGHVILGFTSIVQTIPSLALLALLVPLPFFGISVRTAIAALFLYGLLPIVRNTATGLQDIPRALRESATALGLSSRARLWQIYLPMASRSILAGIKTSAVINVGTATLAALIGAGGLGEPILSGLDLNDHATILQGAIPAAILALLVQWLFDLLDRVLIPKGLRF